MTLLISLTPTLRILCVSELLKVLLQVICSVLLWRSREKVQKRKSSGCSNRVNDELAN